MLGLLKVSSAVPGSPDVPSPEPPAAVWPVWSVPLLVGVIQAPHVAFSPVPGSVSNPGPASRHRLRDHAPHAVRSPYAITLGCSSESPRPGHIAGGGFRPRRVSDATLRRCIRRSHATSRHPCAQDSIFWQFVCLVLPSQVSRLFRTLYYRSRPEKTFSTRLIISFSVHVAKHRQSWRVRRVIGCGWVSVSAEFCGKLSCGRPSSSLLSTFALTPACCLSFACGLQ